jgi:hypothetical protein
MGILCNDEGSLNLPTTLDLMAFLAFCDKSYHPIKHAFREFLNLALPITMDRPDSAILPHLNSNSFQDFEEIIQGLEQPKTLKEFVLVFAVWLAENLSLQKEFAAASLAGVKSPTKMHSYSKKVPTFESLLSRWVMQFSNLHSSDLNFLEEMQELRSRCESIPDFSESPLFHAS